MFQVFVDDQQQTWLFRVVIISLNAIFRVEFHEQDKELGS